MSPRLVISAQAEFLNLMEGFRISNRTLFRQSALLINVRTDKGKEVGHSL